MEPSMSNSGWGEPRRYVNPNQPFVEEFPGLLCWNQDDENVCHVLKCQEGMTPYLRGALLGVGGFCRVYKVLREADGNLFAGKSSQVIQKMRQEARVLRRFQHYHILRYDGWYEETNHPGATLFLTELCAGGDLNTCINNATHGMTSNQILEVVKQMASALHYLHSQSMFHSDLKPRNIFIRSFSPMNVVLGDCADVKSTSYRGELLGTPGFYSPEIIQHKRHMGAGDDIWALGVTALGMMAQWPRVLYIRKGRKDVRQIQEYPKQCWAHVGKLAELNVGHGIVTLLEKMLTWTVRERIAAGELGVMVATVMESYEAAGDGQLDITAPEDFHPIEFW